MKKSLTFILALILTLSVFQMRVEAVFLPFADVKENHWAFKEIIEVYQFGIMKGTGNIGMERYFSPDDKLTMAQFLTVIGRAFYRPEFEAIGTGKWYEPAYQIAVRHGLLDETLQTNLEQILNRRQMAVILYRLLKDFEVDSMPQEHFLSHDRKITDWHHLSTEEEQKAVSEMFRLGILQGVGGGTVFAPNQSFVRAEMAVVYNRLQKLLFSAVKKRNSFFYGQRVIDLVNIERKKVGLVPLKMDLILMEASLIRVDEILEVFEHQRPDGRNFSTVVLDDFGYNYWALGENIAKGFISPESVVKAWMDSKGHRDNILNPDFTHIGVGDYDGGWVQLFSKPR